MGYFFALASMFSFSVTSTIQKHISLNVDLRKALFIQYFITTLFSAAAVFFLDTFGFSLEGSWKLLIILGLFGYLWIWSLLMGFKHLPTAVVATVSYLYVFVAFFLQHFLFSGAENLSLGKIIVAIVFFLVTCFFLFEHSGEKWSINKGVIYPIMTAVSWAIYYSCCNYGVKNGMFTPIQMTFYSEVPILLVAGIIAIPAYLNKQKERLSGKSLLAVSGSAFTTFLGAIFLNFAYGSLNGNVVNIISLATIVTIPVLTFIVYKERLTPKDSILIGISLVLLFVFQWIK